MTKDSEFEGLHSKEARAYTRVTNRCLKDGDKLEDLAEPLQDAFFDANLPHNVFQAAPDTVRVHPTLFTNPKPVRKPRPPAKLEHPSESIKEPSLIEQCANLGLGTAEAIGKTVVGSIMKILK